MNKEIFFKWLRINILFFVGAFVITMFLALLFPDMMLGFVRSWGARSGLISSTFVTIFAWNGLVTVLFFITSLFFLAPLVAVILGTFYSLGLMSAIDHFIKGEIWYPLWSSPALIAIETSFFLLTITFASALGTEIFGVKPGRKEIMNHWKKNWKKLLPEQKRDWMVVFKENKKELILFIMIILTLILFGAWFEVLI